MARLVGGAGAGPSAKLSARMRAWMASQKAEEAALCAKVMESIDRYIELHDVRGIDGLKSAASDVCDGWVTRREINALVCGRRLRLLGRARDIDDVCGNLSGDWSVHLHEREIQARYADRLTVAKRGRKKGKARH
jgi:hypothetical protein